VEVEKLPHTYTTWTNADNLVSLSDDTDKRFFVGSLGWGCVFHFGGWLLRV